MTFSKQIKSSVLGVVWLCALADASAMSLGRARSVALLGQPLDLTVPVQFDPEERGSSLCFDADVYFGDNKLESSQVAVLPQIPEVQSGGSIKVFTRVAIDEPVVTVYLRAGCSQKVTRRFVLLADLATELAPPVPVASVETRVAAVALPKLGADVPAVPTVEQSLRKPGKARPPRVERSLPEDADAGRAPDRGLGKSLKITQGAPSRRSHLKLLPLDLAAERDPILKLSNELLLVAPEDPAKRSEAIALWRSLNMTVQEMAKEQARISALEAELKAQKELSAKSGQSMQELSNRAETAEDERYANPLVYGLGTLVVALAGALGYLWNQLRGRGVASPWWRGKSDEGELVDLDEDDRFGQPGRGKGAVPSPQVDETDKADAPSTDDEHQEVDIDIDLNLTDSVFAAPDVRPSLVAAVAAADSALKPAVVPLHSDFSHSTMEGIRSLNMKEMFDVQQQAEFFMTLGQYDEAIDLLKSNIDDSGESSPVVYLELLKALHSLSRKADFDHYRQDFNIRFTGRVPDYIGFNDAGEDLEAYPQIMQSIVAAWGTQAVLDVIESCLVRTLETSSEVGIDLNAYRDLLLLHGIAKRNLSVSDSGPAPFSTSKLDFPSVPELAEEQEPQDLLQDIVPVDLALPDVDLSSDDFAVDLDLSEGASNLIEFDADRLSTKVPLNDRDR